MKHVSCLVLVGLGLMPAPLLLAAPLEDRMLGVERPASPLDGGTFTVEAQTIGLGEFHLADAATETTKEGMLLTLTPSPRLSAETAPFAERPRTRMQRLLISLIRAQTGEILPQAVVEEDTTPLFGSDDAIVLEPLKVTVEKVIALPGIETGKQRFWRTGAIWERVGSHPAMTFAFRPDRGGLIFNLASL